MSLFPKLQFLIISVCDLGTLDDELGMDIADLILNEALRFYISSQKFRADLSKWQMLGSVCAPG